MKRILQAALGKFGYRLSRVANTPKDGLTSFFEAIQRAGFVPRHIVDVGANHGNWSRSAIRFFPDAQYTLVEPQDHLKVHIQDIDYFVFTKVSIITKLRNSLSAAPAGTTG